MGLLTLLVAVSLGVTLVTSVTRSDKTECVSNIETSEGLHISCYCDHVTHVNTEINEVRKPLDTEMSIMSICLSSLVLRK